jgi:hypothetical protein
MATEKTYRVEFIRRGEKTSVDIVTDKGPGYAVEEVYTLRYSADEVTDVVEV